MVGKGTKLGKKAAERDSVGNRVLRGVNQEADRAGVQ